MQVICRQRIAIKSEVDSKYLLSGLFVVFFNGTVVRQLRAAPGLILQPTLWEGSWIKVRRRVCQLYRFLKGLVYHASEKSCQEVPIASNPPT